MAKALISAVLAAAVFVACTSAGRVSLLGRESDPCADEFQWLGGTSRPTCLATSDPLTDNAVTVYIPSQSTRWASAPNPPFTLGTFPATVTLTVRSDQTVLATAQVQPGDSVCLGGIGAGDEVGPCTATDCVPLVGVAGSNTFTFTIPTGAADGWNRLDRELERAPRRLCLLRGATLFYTGLLIATEADCFNDNSLCGRTDIGTGAASLEISQRTVCCSIPTATQGIINGICIDPRLQSCCGGTPFNNGIERCCDRVSQVVRADDEHCPCFRTDTPPFHTACPTNELCCLPSRFPVFNPNLRNGNCFNPAQWRCCDTGAVYDPGMQQCCSISGLQSLDTPCPCGVDSDCWGGQAKLFPGQAMRTQRCCKQTFPPLREEAVCDVFINFPSQVDVRNAALRVDATRLPGQTDPAQLSNLLARCQGRCVDTSFQICCNGVACHQWYEKCCNSTCCNTYVGTCSDGFRATTMNNPNNYNGIRVRYEVCTVIENLGPIEAFWVFFFPTFLLVATLLALAFVIILAHTVTGRAYSFIESALMIFAVITILFAIPTFFSPTYKYGVVIALACYVIFLSGTSRTLWLNVFAVGATLLLIMYLFDPFHGNDLINFASLRIPNGNPDEEASGLVTSVGKSWRGTQRVLREQYCVRYYNYFLLDPNLRDETRVDDPMDRTFGYCSRGWIAVLIIFEGIVLMLSLILFTLVLLALILRFRKVVFTPLDLEVAPPIAPAPIIVEQPLKQPIYVDEPAFYQPAPIFA